MAYADVAELARLLNLPAPTTAQTEAMQRVLDEAAADIDWCLGYDAQTPAPSPVPPLIVNVNLDRAMELWKQSQTPFGIAVLGPDAVPILTARDSFYRHSLRLAPLKTGWGVA